MSTAQAFEPGTLVSARGRDWVVLPDSTADVLIVRPLGGSEDDVAAVLPQVEMVKSASFPPPTPGDLGDQMSASLLRAAMRIGFRSTAGPSAASLDWLCSRAPISSSRC